MIQIQRHINGAWETEGSSEPSGLPTGMFGVEWKSDHESPALKRFQPSEEGPTTGMINALKHGRITFYRPRGRIGHTETVLDFYSFSEALAYSSWPKHMKVRIIDTERTNVDFYDGTALFYGYVDRHTWNEDTKTVRVTLRDYLYRKKDMETHGELFVNKTVSQILEYYAKDAQRGMGFHTTRYLPDAGSAKYDPTIPYLYIEPDTPYHQILNDMAEALGGKLYQSPGRENPTLIVEFGSLYANPAAYASTALVSLTENQSKDIDIEYPPREYNEFVVKSYSKEIKVDVIHLATMDNGFKIPSAGVGVAPKEHYIEFSMPVLKILENNIDFVGCPGVTFDTNLYNTNFIDNNPSGYLKNPNRIQVRFTNSSGNPRELSKWNIKVEGVDEQMIEVAHDVSSGDDWHRKWELDSKIISQDNDWHKRRMNYEIAMLNNEAGFKIVDPSVQPYVGPRTSAQSQPEYVVDLSGAKIEVEELSYNIDRKIWEVWGRVDRSAYNPTELTKEGGATGEKPKPDPEFPDPLEPTPATPNAPTLSSAPNTAQNRMILTVNVGGQTGPFDYVVWENVTGAEVTFGFTAGNVSIPVNHSMAYRAKIRRLGEYKKSEWSAQSAAHTTGALAVPNPVTLNVLTTTFNTANHYSSVTATWSSSAAPDFSSYEIEWFQGDDRIGSYHITDIATLTYIHVVPQAATIKARVRVWNDKGLFSTWSTLRSITSAHDTQTPANITTLTARPSLRTILLFLAWPGFDSKLIYFEVEVSVNSGGYAFIRRIYDEWFEYEPADPSNKATTYRFRARPVREHNVIGAWSYSDTVTLGDATNIISDMHVADLRADKLNAGFLSADRINSGTISFEKLTSGTYNLGAGTGTKLALTNNIEIGHNVGPQQVGGIYVYQPDGRGYVLNSNGLGYTNGYTMLPLVTFVYSGTHEYVHNPALTEAQILAGQKIPLHMSFPPGSLDVQISLSSFDVIADGSGLRITTQHSFDYDAQGRITHVNVAAFRAAVTQYFVNVPASLSISGARNTTNPLQTDTIRAQVVEGLIATPSSLGFSTNRLVAFSSDPFVFSQPLSTTKTMTINPNGWYVKDQEWTGHWKSWRGVATMTWLDTTTKYTYNQTNWESAMTWQNTYYQQVGRLYSAVVSGWKFGNPESINATVNVHILFKGE